MHKGLEFRNEDASGLSADKSLMTKVLGNVTRDTEVTFEYRLKKVKELLAIKEINFEDITEFPF